jgi:ABC-type xylose transport system permease subunit
VILIFLAVVVVSDFLLRRSTLFRKVFYTGSNEKAALYSGIKWATVKFWVTVLCSPRPAWPASSTPRASVPPRRPSAWAWNST